MDINETYDYFMKCSEPQSAQALGWSSYEAQQTRFKIISEIGIENTDSVLDVGCGYGDFSYHVGSGYLGIDVREKAIAVAKEKFKIRKFETGNIFNVSDNFDWVVASGIFCFPQEDWNAYVGDTLKKMYELSNKGVAVNFLSGIQQKEDELVYVFPEDIIKILRDITNKFTIRHDYEMKDFTVYLYK